MYGDSYPAIRELGYRRQHLPSVQTYGGDKVKVNKPTQDYKYDSKVINHYDAPKQQVYGPDYGVYDARANARANHVRNYERYYA